MYLIPNVCQNRFVCFVCDEFRIGVNVKNRDQTGPAGIQITRVSVNADGYLY